MKKMFALLCLIPFTLLANTYYPDGFENMAKTGAIKDQQLKDKIFKVLNSFHKKVPGKNDVVLEQCAPGTCYSQTILGYSSARDYLFGMLDLKEDTKGYYLVYVYCHTEYRGPDVGKLRTPKARVVNCEHTWPQSLFSKDFNNEMQKSDLHHLFVTRNDANLVRSSHPFGDNEGKPAVSDCNHSTIGGARNSTLVFEPPREHKGNVARALFYFSIRYKLPIDDFTERTMRAWNKDDPVNIDDLARNDQIYALQNNRNPFVDFPELIDLISDF